MYYCYPNLNLNICCHEKIHEWGLYGVESVVLIFVSVMFGEIDFLSRGDKLKILVLWGKCSSKWPGYKHTFGNYLYSQMVGCIYLSRKYSFWWTYLYGILLRIKNIPWTVVGYLNINYEHLPSALPVTCF